MWMRGYHTSPRLKSYMPRHRFLYATTCSNTCRFWLVFYEPLCWEARHDRCFEDHGCEGSPMSTLYGRKSNSSTLGNSRGRYRCSILTNNLSVGHGIDMHSRRVTFEVTSQIVRLLVTCRSSLGHHVSYLRTQHRSDSFPLMHPASRIFTFLARSPCHLML